MNPPDLSGRLFDALQQHVPPGAGWLTVSLAIGAIALGALFLAKGARLAPALAGLVLGGCGAIGGFVAGPLVSLPVWPATLGAGTVGVVLGVVLFRFWFALLVGGCAAFIGLSVYGSQVLRGPANDYLSRGYDAETEMVTLLEPGEQPVQPVGWQQEMSGLWSYLNEHVPHLPGSLIAITLATGLAGLAFAFLLPRVARAFWGASLGVLLLMPGVMVVLHLYWPAGAMWLERWGLLVAVLIWGASVVQNLLDMVERRPKKDAAAEGQPART